MTLIVIALDHDKQGIFCVSDTRISNADKSILSDVTAKIIPFTAVSTFSVHKPKRRRIEWREDYCFCFAGSTLLANSVFALGSNICRNIYTSKNSTRPSLELYAEFFRFALEKVSFDLNSRAASGSGSGYMKFDAEFALFGYDKLSRQAKAVLIKQKIFDGQYSSITEPYPPESVYVALGEKSAFNAVMMHQYKRLRETGQKLDILEGVKAVHSDKSIGGVGGGIQTCFVDKSGIEVPVNLDANDLSLKLFGIPCDSKTNYSSEYTIGDISIGAKIRGL